MTDAVHLTLEELEAGLDEIRDAPKEEGELKLIVRRPQPWWRGLPTAGRSPATSSSSTWI